MRTADDDLHDFELSEFTHNGKTPQFFAVAVAPRVIVIAEMPGISPKVLDFAHKVADVGLTAVLPHLFGEPGRDPLPVARGTAATIKCMASSMIPACVSKGFTVMATGRTSPVVDWLRALARAEHEERATISSLDRSGGGLDAAENLVAGAQLIISSARRMAVLARGRRVAISISRAGSPPRRSLSRKRIARQFVSDVTPKAQRIGDRALRRVGPDLLVGARYRGPVTADVERLAVEQMPCNGAGASRRS